VCQNSEYFEETVAQLPQLKMLDGEQIVLKKSLHNTLKDLADAENEEPDELPPAEPWCKDIDLGVPPALTQRDIDRMTKPLGGKGRAVDFFFAVSVVSSSCGQNSFLHRHHRLACGLQTPPHVGRLGTVISRAAYGR
jgi:hypothetical protein